MILNLTVCNTVLSDLSEALSVVYPLYITKTRPCNIQQLLKIVKKDNFQMKNYEIFLIFAQNIDSGYTLELPH